MDLKRINEAVKRETYMLPNLNGIASKLSGTTVFSNLEATSAFHQILSHRLIVIGIEDFRSGLRQLRKISSPK